MAFPLIPIITAAISAFGEKKVPGTQRAIGEFTNKTNGWASSVITFSIYQLTQFPQDKFYMFLIVFCVFMITIRDTAEKAMGILKGIKNH